MIFKARLYSLSTLVTPVLSFVLLMGLKEFPWSKVSQRLVRSHSVIYPFPF